jgi:hypothetical protein
MEEVFAQARTETPPPPSPASDGAVFNPDMYPLDAGAAPLLPAVGATLGGLAGGGLLSVPFAAAGGALGEAGKQLLEGGSVDPVSVAKEGAWQGAMQAGGLGAAKLLGKVAAPLTKKLEPKVGELVDAFKSYGGKFSPAQVTSSKLMDTVEEIAGESLTGRETVTKFRLGQKEAVGRFVEDLSSKLGTSADPADVGRIALDAIEGNFETFNRAAKTMYGQVDTLSKGAVVSLTGLKSFAKEQLLVAEARKGIGGSMAGDSLLSKVTELPDTMTFKQAQSLRSGLWDELHNSLANRDKATGLAKRFLALTDDAMETGAKGLGNDAYQAWRDANSFYRTNKEVFKTKLIARLSKDNPEIIVDQVFRPGRVSNIQKVREALKGTPEAWDQLKGAYFNKLITQSSDESGSVIGDKLLNNLKRMGDPSLKEIFGENAKNLDLLARTAKTVQTKVGGSGGMLIQLTQAGAFGSLVAMQYPKAGLSVLVGPYAAAKLITSDAGIQWLTKGMATPANAADAIAISTRLLREVGMSGGVKVNFPQKDRKPQTPLTDKLLYQ